MITSKYLSNVDDCLIEMLAKTTEDLWSIPDNDKRANAHALFQYPAMMVPAVVENLFKLMTTAQPNIESVFDPYVGAGTTLTAAMLKGLSCYGQDINPLAILLSQVKTGPFFLVALTSRLNQVLETAQNDTSLVIDVEFPNLDKWFKQDVSIELSRLRRAIRADSQLWARKFMWVVLAETIRLTSNDRTSTYKLHARPLTEIDARSLSPIAVFTELAMQGVEDLSCFKNKLQNCAQLTQGRYKNDVDIVIADTKQGIQLEETPFDLVVTSPPYGDNLTTITYGQHSYLPLHWIDLDDISPKLDHSLLRTTQEIDRRSLGGVKSNDMLDQMEILATKSVVLNQIFENLKEKPLDRTARIVDFYRDFDCALEHIVSSLKENGYMIWIIGNRHVGGVEIENDRIIIELLEQKKTEFVTDFERQIHGKRMPHRNQISRLMSKERILIFRKTR